MTLTPSASVKFREADKWLPASLVVQVVWSSDAPIDQPSYAISCPNPKVAERLLRAIAAGAVFKNPAVVVGCDGKTYVKGNCRVLGRTLSADLKRLGY